MKAADVLVAGFTSEELEVPGWPEKVVVRQLGALDAVRWRATLTAPGDNARPGDDLRQAAHLVVLCLFNVAGERLFDESQVDQVANLPDPILTLLTKTVTRINGLSAGDIQKAEEDFGAAPS